MALVRKQPAPRIPRRFLPIKRVDPLVRKQPFGALPSVQDYPIAYLGLAAVAAYFFLRRK